MRSRCPGAAPDPRPDRPRARSIRRSPGLTRGAAGRALLGGIGYLWIAAWEELAHKTLLLGPVADPPAHWKGSAGTAISDVLMPLIDGSVLAAAGIFAAAALVLPVLVRGRTPLLDALGR